MVSSAPRGRADPERPVDGDVDAAPVLGGDQLVDRGVDRGVLAADAGTGDGRGRRSTTRVHRERGQHRADQIDAEGDQEQLLAAEPVGQLAEEQRADAGAGDVDRARLADVGAGHAQARVSGLRASDIEPTIVTSRPSRIHTVPGR